VRHPAPVELRGRVAICARVDVDSVLRILDETEEIEATEPHLWHGNTLTREEIYSGLYQNAPDRFDVILTNPPFGGKEKFPNFESFFFS
jgi:hypothetical protein